MAVPSPGSDEAVVRVVGVGVGDGQVMMVLREVIGWCRGALALWLCVLVLTPTVVTANQIKGLDDAILFRLNWAGGDAGLLVSACVCLRSSDCLNVYYYLTCL